MTADIVAFLNARYRGEAEAAHLFHRWSCKATDQERNDGALFVLDQCDCGHEASVLADIAAKRTILEACEDALVVVGGTGYGLALQVLRAQVGPFSAHPDFDPAWTVET